MTLYIILKTLLLFGAVVFGGYAADYFVEKAGLKWKNAGPVVAAAIAGCAVFYVVSGYFLQA